MLSKIAISKTNKCLAQVLCSHIKLRLRANGWINPTQGHSQDSGMGEGVEGGNQHFRWKVSNKKRASQWVISTFIYVILTSTMLPTPLKKIQWFCVNLKTLDQAQQYWDPAPVTPSPSYANDPTQRNAYTFSNGNWTAAFTLWHGNQKHWNIETFAKCFVFVVVIDDNNRNEYICNVLTVKTTTTINLWYVKTNNIHGSVSASHTISRAPPFRFWNGIWGAITP